MSIEKLTRGIVNEIVRRRVDRGERSVPLDEVTDEVLERFGGVWHDEADEQSVEFWRHWCYRSVFRVVGAAVRKLGPDVDVDVDDDDEVEPVQLPLPFPDLPLVRPMYSVERDGRMFAVLFEELTYAEGQEKLSELRKDIERKAEHAAQLERALERRWGRS